MQVRIRRGQGDQEALQRAYRDNVEAVYAFFAYAVDPTTAEDLTAAAFERVVRSWRRFDPARASERTWILAIARNLLTDHFRRAGRARTVSLDEHPALLERLVEEDRSAEILAADELKRLLAPLAPRDRQVVALRYAADLEGAEIAALLGLTTGNVHQILSRSLRRLRAVAEAEAADAQSQRLTRRSTSV
jgi:RNA polymerase sigma-70 factor (ECF subfamily)